MKEYRDREEAGRQLAEHLKQFEAEMPILLAIPKGGIPLAVPVALKLNSSIGIVPIRGLAISWQDGTIYGYVTDKGDLHLNHALVGQLRLTQAQVRQAAKRERQRLLEEFNGWGTEPPTNLSQRSVILVDDGMHSGWTMFSAIETVKSLGAEKVVVAVPVSHSRAERFVGNHCNQVISLLTDASALFTISQYYQNFPELSNEEVGSLLKAQRNRESAA